MVFSTSAVAFLHLNEHQSHEQSHTEEHPYSDVQYDEAHDTELELDHGHHFDLHVIGDVVDFYDTISFTKSDFLYGDEYCSRLVSRTDTPLIPPPNA